MMCCPRFGAPAKAFSASRYNMSDWGRNRWRPLCISGIIGGGMTEPILRVRDLNSAFFSKEGIVRAVQGVGFELKPGKVLAVVGESGCGKSTLALSLLRLLPFPGKVTKGEVWFQGKDLLQADEEELRRIR